MTNNPNPGFFSFFVRGKGVGYRGGEQGWGQENWHGTQTKDTIFIKTQNPKRLI